jgi:acetyltransferase-like isoleucine patch superfamily enzyme
MLTPQDKQRLTEDRLLVRRWLGGDSAEPLVIPRHRTYPPRAVLWAGLGAQVRQNWRSLWILIAGVLPWSPWKISIYRLLGMKIGRGVYIGPGVLVDPLYPELITLQEGCFLGIGCRLFTHEITASNFRLGRVVIGTGSVIGAYATIRSGVSIGSGVTVGFNSFVNRDVSDGVTVAGVPARRIETGQRAE